MDGNVALHYRGPRHGRIAAMAGLRFPSPSVWRNILSFDVGPSRYRVGADDRSGGWYSRYLGRTGYDAAYAVAVDAAGNVYVTGETSSVDFTSSLGLRSSRDVFVSKVSPDGSQVLYTRFSPAAATMQARQLPWMAPAAFGWRAWPEVQASLLPPEF